MYVKENLLWCNLSMRKMITVRLIDGKTSKDRPRNEYIKRATWVAQIKDKVMENLLRWFYNEDLKGLQ